MILSAIQSAIRGTVRDFAQEQIKPHSFAFEAAKGYPPRFPSSSQRSVCWA